MLTARDKQLHDLFKSLQQQIDGLQDMFTVDEPVVRATILRKIEQSRETMRRLMIFAFEGQTVSENADSRPSLPVRVARDSAKAVSDNKPAVLISTVLTLVVTFVLEYLKR